MPGDQLDSGDDMAQPLPELVEVSLDDPVSALGPRFLVETDAGPVLVERTLNKNVCRMVAHMPEGTRDTTSRIPVDRSLREALAIACRCLPRRAFQIRGVTFELGKAVPRFSRRTATIWVGLALVVTGLALTWLNQWWLLLSVLGMWTAFGAISGYWSPRQTSPWMVKYRDALIPAEDFELPPVVEEVDVEQIRAEYGRLVSDIVYRIENPAFFDPLVPATGEFTLALLQWDNNDGIVTPERRRDLARRVEKTFTAARDNAERLGMTHLPASARNTAQTALAAAKLATDPGTTQAERETALKRAVELLDSLALYYLPTGTDTRRAIEGHEPLALPARKTL